MGIFNFLKEVCDPYSMSDFNDLVNNHREALDNWVRGGYRPRIIIPVSERVQFNEYDKEYDFISSRLYHPIWIDYKDMSYEQKSFIAGRKQQILGLYAIFHKYERRVSDIAKIAEKYPYGFNSIAIKYGKFRIKNLYVESCDILNRSKKQSERNTANTISEAYKSASAIISRTNIISNFYALDLNFSSYATAQVVDNVHLLTPEQCAVISSHMDELRSENMRLSQKYKEEQDAKRRKREKELTDKALFIAKCNPLAYKEFFNYSLDDISLLRAKQIVEKEEVIKATEIKMRDEIQARKRKEEEKRNLSTILPKCVSSWGSHSNSTMKHKYFFDYYTYANYKYQASDSIKETWRLIWNFKNDPAKNISIYDHENALKKVTDLVENELRSTFGSKTEYLTLVCLTASSRQKYELRYKDFAKKICSDLNMTNAYPYIKVVEDGDAKHDGGTGSQTVSYDKYFFSGKYVILFDDIRTTGKSLEQARHILEEMGAKVICAVTIGQTIH